MKKIYNILVLFIAFTGIITSQYLFDAQQKKKKFKEPFILKPEVIKAADLGLHNTASDLVWIKAIQYFGGSESKTYEKLPEYLSLTSDLDPKFSYPYAFGALILPSIGYTDQGIELAKKGLENSLSDWRVPYYLATAYYIDESNLPDAAKYFDLAANTKDAPEGIKKVAANFGSRGTKREQTEQIWTGIYESTSDSVVKERAKNYILHLQILDLLEQASKQYYSINKEYPDDVNDLVSAKILSMIPTDPFGFTFKVDSDGTASIK